MFELQHFAMVHAFLLGPTFSLCTYSALSINFGLDVQLAIASDLKHRITKCACPIYTRTVTSFVSSLSACMPLPAQWGRDRSGRVSSPEKVKT